MIELISQIDSKITACCLFMQLIGNWLVPSMLAAGANRKIGPVRILCKIFLCNSICSFLPSAFLFHYYFFSASFQQVSLIYLNC